MKKIKQKPNTLIKRNQMIKLLKREGINRINPISLNEIEKNLRIYLKKIIKKAKENIITHGRRTLLKKDIQSINEEKQQDWEV